ncbi:phosphate starvation protein PhoH [Thiomicrorhabdus immobilis]|uniref:Phosphate starvation protein PhoH n=1 Tax=Thiomicrorhabdus immobilis TaxID=2791037 RepID=A0ABM7MDW6_9GAMM|nr:PhoH family protein [Thiomicrorhabdus immobilis]BCN93633.1 phosphate starvation protein PhoH [Thiomicrorhabdus immobilis]
MTNESKRLFILDTNVLMHDPMALFNFEEHDIFLSMTVLEELDAGKKGMSEVSRNVRETNRLIDQIISDASFEEIKAGLSLERIHPNPSQDTLHLGKLFFETEPLAVDLPDYLPSHKADNHILQTGLALKEKYSNRNVTLVTKDINMRIKSSAVGLHSEDYFNDRVLEDADLLYTGWEHLEDNFFETHGKNMKSWQEGSRTFYELEIDSKCRWFPNQGLISQNDAGFNAIVRKIGHGKATLEYMEDFENPHHSIWGINARNTEQNIALNYLMDPEIDFVSLLGTAGTGKTLLTLAAALEQTLDQNIYNEIIMTRATIPVGEDIGFLPGTEEEKMTPWMGALMDNLEVLTDSDGYTDWEKESTQQLLSKRIKIKSMNFMRGRTFQKKFIILDEAQNLTPKQMKTLITRAGEGTKVVCLGNIGQIDSPYLTETTTGLTYVVDRFKQWEHSAHITLQQGERSRLAEFASDNL